MKRTAALVALLLVTAGCTSDLPGAGKRMPVGEIVRAMSVAPGRMSHVLLPTSRIDFTLTAPHEELPTYDSESGYESAPDGGSVVGVGWEWEFWSPTMDAVTDDESQPVPSIDLVVGERRYSLDEAMVRPEGEEGGVLEYFGTAWVALAEAPDSDAVQDATLVVTYDGVEQEVEPGEQRAGDDSPAKALYGGLGLANGRYRADCGAPDIGRPVQWGGNEYCWVEVFRTPWYQPVGWAPPGEAWTVVTVGASPGSTLDDASGYLTLDEVPARVSVTLDDRKPREEWAGDSDVPVSKTLLFGPSLRGQLEISGRWTSHDGNDRVRTEKLTWSVELYG